MPKFKKSSNILNIHNVIKHSKTNTLHKNVVSTAGAHTEVEGLK